MVAALDIRNLTKSYATGKLALRGVDLRVEQGDFFALLGPNGAGKSTLIGTVSGLVNKSGGTVEIFGHDIDREFSLAKKQLGVVPQEFNFNQFEKVIDIVMTQAGLYGLPVTLARARAEKYLGKLGLWEKRNERSRFLSGGMKRRLMIARALVHEPRMLILDEPTAGVDIELRRSMWDFLKEINTITGQSFYDRFTQGDSGVISNAIVWYNLMLFVKKDNLNFKMKDGDKIVFLRTIPGGG